MPTNFVLGFLFIWLGRHEVRKHADKVFTVPLMLAWAWSAFIFCPATGWSFYAYPAWATVYLRPEASIPSWSGPVIVSFYFLGMVFGSLLAQFLIQKNQIKVFWAMFGLGLFWLLSITGLTMTEYQLIGTYEQFHAGTAQSMFENADFMMALNIMGAVIAIPGVGLAAYIWRRSRLEVLGAT